MIQGLFSNAKKILLEGGLNFASDTFKVGMLTSAYSLNTGNDVWGDLSAHQIVPSGDYVDGGVALAGKTVTEDEVNKEGVFDATDLTIGNVTAADVRYFILYKDGATKTLIAFVDLEAPVAYAANNVKLTFHANGVMRVM